MHTADHAFRLDCLNKSSGIVSHIFVLINRPQEIVLRKSSSGSTTPVLFHQLSAEVEAVGALQSRWDDTHMNEWSVLDHVNVVFGRNIVVELQQKHTDT